MVCMLYDRQPRCIGIIMFEALLESQVVLYLLVVGVGYNTMIMDCMLIICMCK